MYFRVNLFGERNEQKSIVEKKNTTCVSQGGNLFSNTKHHNTLLINHIEESKQLVFPSNFTMILIIDNEMKTPFFIYHPNSPFQQPNSCQSIKISYPIQSYCKQQFHLKSYVLPYDQTRVNPWKSFHSFPFKDIKLSFI